MKTKQQTMTAAYDPSWIIELAKKEIPLRTDIIDALGKCTRCRWDSPAYAYFNEGLPLKDGAMLNHPEKGLIIIDMTACGKVAGIEFVKELNDEGDFFLNVDFSKFANSEITIHKTGFPPLKIVT